MHINKIAVLVSPLSENLENNLKLNIHHYERASALILKHLGINEEEIRCFEARSVAR
jgi:hypothetical protein